MTTDFPAAGSALVIGGSGGIGRAIGDALVAAGSKVALTYRRNPVSFESPGTTAHAIDLADPDSITACIAEVAAAHDGIHTLIYAAGSDIPMRYTSQVSAAEWQDVMTADAGGFFHAVRAAVPHLRQTRGSIVAISTAGLGRFPPKDILSVAPKAAIEAVICAVAREEGKHGVRANALRVGVVDAGMFERVKQQLSGEWLEAAKQNAALRRFGTAEEVANAAIFLASARASYITGQSLTVDGGYAV